MAAAHAHDDRRTRLYQAMLTALTGTISDEELDIHFALMPPRYWTHVNSHTLQRHLEIIHAFLANLNATDSDATQPIVHWHHLPKRHLTEVEVCTWDRLGLLAKVAGAFARAGLNIARADIHTRGDDIVLDVFEVTEPGGGHVRDEARLHEMARILTAALRPHSTEPLGPVVPPPPGSTPQITIRADGPEPHTILEVEADDRLGLLYRIFTVLTSSDINIVHAIITTEAGRAGDVFYLTDSNGNKITAPARLEEIRQRVLVSLT
jgi:[protein-PII] uridylyltransferase